MDRQNLNIATQLRTNRNFLLLFGAYGISALGDHLSEMSILKMKGAVEAGADATPINARMTFMFFLPFLLIAPFAGILADRLPRRGIMIFADLVRCLLMFSLGGLISLTNHWGPLAQFTPLLVVGCFAALFSPARGALLPTLIQPDQLQRANGMISGLGIIATMASTVAGGWLAQHYAPHVAFRMDAITFLVSAACLAWIRAPVQTNLAATVQRSNLLGDLRHGLRYARAHRHVWELLLIAGLVWFCGAMVNTVVPAVVSDVYGGSVSAIGLFRALLGAGFVLGGVLIAIFGNSLRQEIAISWGLMGVGCGMAVFALTIFVPLSATITAPVGGFSIIFAGLFAAVVIASYTSLLQRTVPNRIRGRIFGVSDLCTTAALLLATGSLGLPAWTNLDTWVGYILAGIAVMVFVAGAMTFQVRMRRSPFRPVLTFWLHASEFFARCWWGLKRVGPCTVPGKGGVIITSNHRCTADPLFYCATIPNRLISFMVAKEYTVWPVFRYFLWLDEAIPVTRSGQDTGAMKQAMRHLRDGKAMGIFIEGGIVAPGEKSEPRDGLAMLALRTGAKVVPAYISGVRYRDNVLMSLIGRQHARIRYGAPLDLSDLAEDPGNRDNVRAATQRIYAAIQALAPPDDVYEGDEPKRKRRRQEKSDLEKSEPSAKATDSKPTETIPS